MLATKEDPCSFPKSVVFFDSKKQTVDVYLFLQKSAARPNFVGAYHASLTEDTKFFIRQNFLSKTTELRCLCATVAFGMVSVYHASFNLIIVIFFSGDGYT